MSNVCQKFIETGYDYDLWHVKLVANCTFSADGMIVMPYVTRNQTSDADSLEFIILETDTYFAGNNNVVMSHEGEIVRVYTAEAQDSEPMIFGIAMFNPTGGSINLTKAF